MAETRETCQLCPNDLEQQTSNKGVIVSFLNAGQFDLFMQIKILEAHRMSWHAEQSDLSIRLGLLPFSSLRVDFDPEQVI